MHDTVWFEIQGMPAVTIASEEFAEAARIQAQALGLKSARCVYVKHPIQDATDAEMQEKAESVVDAVIQALTTEKN